MKGFATFIAMLLMIAIVGGYSFGMISLDTVLIAGMIDCVGLMISSK